MLPAASPLCAQEYDARLSDYEYPSPVQYRSFEAQRQALEMAYMDVGPQKAQHAVLLLHGRNFSGAYWACTIEALVAEG